MSIRAWMTRRIWLGFLIPLSKTIDLSLDKYFLNPWINFIKVPFGEISSIELNFFHQYIVKIHIKQAFNKFPQSIGLLMQVIEIYLTLREIIFVRILLLVNT